MKRRDLYGCMMEKCDKIVKNFRKERRR